VVIRCSGEAAMADLQDTMELLLLHLATASVAATLNTLNVVKVFVFGIKEKMDLEKKVEKETKVEEDDDEGLVTRMVLELEAERMVEEREEKELLEKLECPAEGFHEDETQTEVAEEAAEEDAEPPLSPEQRFLKVVVEHVRNFVSMSGQPAWQLAAISSLACSLSLLSSTPGQLPGERQTVLLPLVHQAWHPLRLLFRSPNIFVVDSAFHCLMVVARAARDFIRKRTVTDVLPPLLGFFKTLQVMVGERALQATLAATQARRILGRLEEGVWALLHLLDLPPVETDAVIQLVVDHLGHRLEASSTHSSSPPSSSTHSSSPSSSSTLSSSNPSSSFQPKPKRSVDANILWLKLNHRQVS